MNNKNGFTLVEVLGVIVILGILALLVTNGIMGYFNEGKQTYNDKLKDQLTISGKNYFSDNRYLLPTEVTDKKYAYVTVSEMQSDNYIKNEFLDSEGRKCTESYVFVREATPGTNKYEYTPCLICEGINYSEKSGYCDPSLWKTEPVEENGDHVEDEPETPIVGEFACSGTYEISTGKTIITASSSNKINKMYYVIGDGTDQTNLTLTDKEKSNGKITKKTFTGIPQGANVFIEDMHGNISPKCNIEDCQCTKLSLGYSQGTSSCNSCECKSPKIEKTINGVKHCTEANVPVCSFTSVPTGYIGKSGATLTAECTNDNNTINVVSTNNITVGSKGTITKSYSPTSGSGTKITFTIKYTPKNDQGGVDTVSLLSGLVKNPTTGKVNAAVKENVKVDTTAPVITYTVTGTTQKSEADSGTGYKDKVSVKVTCTDAYSGVKTFKVDGTSTSSPKTVTKSGRGNYTVSSSCTDKSGNSASKSGSYRVLAKTANCSKCGVKEYKSCTGKTCGCKTYNRGSKCACEEWNYKQVPSSYKYYWSNATVLCGGQYSDNRTAQCKASYWHGYKYTKKLGNNNCYNRVQCVRKVTSYTTVKDTCKTRKRCSAAGCHAYKSCAHSACGCKTGKSCWY